MKDFEYTAQGIFPMSLTTSSMFHMIEFALKYLQDYKQLE